MKPAVVLYARKGFALGDVTMVTALARDIAKLHPGEYQVGVDTNSPSLWAHNPFVTPAERLKTTTRSVIHLNYLPGLKDSQAGGRRHALLSFHQDFTRQTGIKVWPTLPHGDLHLTPEEKRPRVEGRYWLVMAGGKLDMTVKHWVAANYQPVVDALAAQGLDCVQVGGTGRTHKHTPLERCLNLVGKTENTRELLSLVYNAEGVICGITSVMHIAACFNKPCVVIAGGREEPSYFGYTNAYEHAFGGECGPVGCEHRVLHTVGLLDCCKGRGCHRKRTVAIEPRDNVPRYKARLCVYPDAVGDGVAPRCMKMIEPDHVVEAVMSYYEKGELPPIGPPSRKYALPVQAAPPVVAKQEAVPAAVGAARSPVRHPVFDHPMLGGKFTVFVLCYGPYPDLARRCVDSILQTVPLDRVSLRVACNACVPETLDYLSNQPLDRLYVFEENRRKYPVMRDVFRDAALPITTPYTVWFDDDSYVLDPKWLEKLGQAIIANHSEGCRLYGWKHLHDVKNYCRGNYDPRQWFWQAPWCRSRQLRVRGTDRMAPNGTAIDFVVGSFWAIHTPVIYEADIPDVRLNHNGGDVLSGLQVTQQGHKIHNFNQGKRIIMSSAAPRRGVSEKMPWANEAGK